MWSNRMFAGWALILSIILMVIAIAHKHYYDFFTLASICTFIVLSQRNDK